MSWHGAGDSEHELSGFTPSFLWLLRDFYLSLEEDGRKVLIFGPALFLSCSQGSCFILHSMLQCRESACVSMLCSVSNCVEFCASSEDTLCR